MPTGANISIDVHAAARILAAIAAMCPPPQCYRHYPFDEDRGMTFLKIPQGVNLLSREQQRGYCGSSANVANLPPELQCVILSHLPAVDRVCLALTCKSIAASAIASSLLRAPPWTPWLAHSETTFPSRELLIQRLAHGWTDKTKLRYCNNCKRILPRDASYFEQQLKKQKRKRLPWNYKVCVEKDQWTKMNKKKRFDHILKMWSESKREDNSVFSCTRCWTNELLPRRDLEKGISDDEGQGWMSPSKVPAECPLCVINSLLNTYKEPRKPKFRPWLWKWTKRTFSLVGHTIVVVIYLIYLLLKAPIDLICWIYKLCKGSKFECKRILCIS